MVRGENDVQQGLNLELTTCCPLHCPQCYCTLEGGRHLELETAKRRLKEAGAHGVRTVHLSGGETMCYPYLYEVVKAAAEACGQVNVAVSGYHFDREALHKLTEAGVNGIFISLNGSTEEINRQTRDGFSLAIETLQLLKKEHFPRTYINWVMHSYNSDDFENVMRLAEAYEVNTVVILAFKPDSRHELKSFPTADQMKRMAEFVKNYRGNVKLGVESCFSQLLALVRDTKLFGNLNVGPMKGCRAGLYNYSINVEGKFSPCRHLDYFEDWDTLDEYWEKSPILNKIRHAEKEKREPCKSCRYADYCRHCMAVSAKLHGDIFIGNDACPLAGLQ